MSNGMEQEDSSWADPSILVGLPMAVRAALMLNVPKIIDSAFPTLSLSANDICIHVQGGTKEHSKSPQNLEKLLDWLSCNGVFSLTVEEGEDGSRVKKYGHSPKSRCLSKDQIADGLLMMTSPELTRVWPHANQTVLNPDLSPFEHVTGKFLYKYFVEDAPDVHRRYVNQLSGTVAPALRLLVERYDEEFKTLEGRVVDVGGQEGSICAALAEKYPHLQFVNFDLPEVVRGAPQIPRVEHVGGSFHESVPPGNLLFMKYCLLNWDDEECVRILANCHDALMAAPETARDGGKMLIIDRLDRSLTTSSNTDKEDKSRTATAWSSFFSSALLKGAKTRTLEQFRSLALAAGFSTLEFVHNSPGYDLMEATIAPRAV